MHMRNYINGAKPYTGIGNYAALATGRELGNRAPER